MADRYRLPEPLCHHRRTGIVTAGGGPGQPHAATNVCDRAACIEDAMAWAEASTHLPPAHRRDAGADPQVPRPRSQPPASGSTR